VEYRRQWDNIFNMLKEEHPTKLSLKNEGKIKNSQVSKN
jgi:hypothetical protein